MHGTARNVPADRARELTAWLDPEHRSSTERLLTSGVRLAQEAVGRRILAAEDDWRETLDGM